MTFEINNDNNNNNNNNCCCLSKEGIRRIPSLRLMHRTQESGRGKQLVSQGKVRKIAQPARVCPGMGPGGLSGALFLRKGEKERAACHARAVLRSSALLLSRLALSAGP